MSVVDEWYEVVLLDQNCQVQLSLAWDIFFAPSLEYIHVIEYCLNKRSWQDSFGVKISTPVRTTFVLRELTSRDTRIPQCREFAWTNLDHVCALWHYERYAVVK